MKMNTTFSRTTAAGMGAYFKFYIFVCPTSKRSYDFFFLWCSGKRKVIQLGFSLLFTIERLVFISIFMLKMMLRLPKKKSL